MLYFNIILSMCQQNKKPRILLSNTRLNSVISDISCELLQDNLRLVDNRSDQCIHKTLDRHGH